MKKLVVYGLLLVVGTLLAESCRKKEANTPSEKVLGRWKLTKEGSDDNGNGLIESFEFKTVVAAKDYEFQFNGDGTGTRYASFDGQKIPDEPFKWHIKGDSLWIGGKYNDTNSYHILNLNASELTITKRPDVGQVGFQWYYYTKK
jgi:hypothetical protein